MIYEDFREIGNIIHNHRRASYGGSYIDYLIIELLGVNRNLKEKEEILVEIYIDTINKKVEEKISYATEADFKKHLMVAEVVGNKQRPVLSGVYSFFKTTKKVDKDTNEIIYNSKFEDRINKIIENRKALYSLPNIEKRISPIIGKITINENDLNAFFEVLETISQPELLNQILELLSDYKEKKGRRYYFTIYIDGKSINEYEAYKYILLTYEFQKVKYRKAVCSCCGKKMLVSDYFVTALPGFKLFTTTNKCFGDVKTGFQNKFNLCADCFIDIYHFIANISLFETSMDYVNKGGVDVLVYPTFLTEEPPDYETLIRLTEKAKKSIKYLGSSYLKSIRDIEDELLDDNKSFYLNILFFTQNQASTRILKRVEDTPPLRLIDLFKEMERQKNRYNKNQRGEGFGNLMVHLNKAMIYSRIDLDQNSKKLFVEDPNEFKIFSQKSYLDLLSLIISGKEITRDVILEPLTKALNNVYFKEGNEMSSPKYRRMVKYSYAILKFMENIGCLKKWEKGVDRVFYEKLKKYKDLSYICRDIVELAEEEEIYDDESLFYVSLGFVLSKVNYSQYRKGNKGLLTNFNFKNLTKKGTEEILLKALEKHMIYTPNEVANAHLFRLMLAYVDKIDDTKMTLSEKALKTHLGIAASTSKTIEKAAKKKKAKDDKNNESFEELISEEKNEDGDILLDKSIYELFDNFLDEYEEEYENLGEGI